MKIKRLAALLIAVNIFTCPAFALEGPPPMPVAEPVVESSLSSDLPSMASEESNSPVTEIENSSAMPFEQEPLTQEDEPTPDNICNNVGDLLETQAHNAYISGYKNGTFNPAGQITRAEAATLFFNLLKEGPQLTADFTDIGTSRWYTTAVRALASLGAIKGYDDGTFRPDNQITRAEFVTIASRFSTILEGEITFTDVRATSWFSKYIASACAHGWISGYPGGAFKPSGKITRAEAVKVLNAMLGRSPDDFVQEIYYTVEFDDVSRSYWAYSEICEASTTHDYTVENGREHWTLPDRYDGTGWTLSEGLVRYRSSQEEGWLKGFNPIGDYTYYFHPETGELQTGWMEVDGYHYLLPGMDQGDNLPEINELLTKTNFTASNRSFGDIEYITVHYTAVPNDTAKGECQYFETQYRGTSASYFVDESGPWRCVADRDVAWHCGNDVYYHDECRNYNSIGIEMCSKKINDANASSPYDSDWYFAEETMEHTAELIRDLMMKYSIPLERVIRHNDVSHKTCPAPFVNDFSAWQDFLSRICEYQTDYDGSYPAEVTAGQLNVRTSPGKDHAIVEVLKKGDSVLVLEERGADNQTEGRWARIDQGWVSYPYICRLGYNP